MCCLLEYEQKHLLLDCGVKLGEKVEYPVLEDDDIKRIKKIFISHAHLDHCGYLPIFFAKGGNAKIILTKPTRDLMSVLLADYQRIQNTSQQHNEFAFKTTDVNKALQASRIVELNVPTDDFVLFNSGHILGSAMIRLNVGGGIIYTGDLCTRKSRILEACERNISGETIIIENTYGGKGDIIPSAKEEAQKLIRLIEGTLMGGGWVLVPAFAVGRAQEILLTLDDYMRSGGLSHARIFVEGMIKKVLRIHRHNAIYANDDIKKRILMSEDDPFKSKFFYVSRSKTREDVLKEPAIIVSTSGMLTGGPALFYLEKLAEDPRNTLIFAGYQSEGTLGRRIADGERKIVLNEKEIEIKMRVEKVKLSAHADYNELIQFIKGVKGLKRIILVHGEKNEIKDALEKQYEVIIPQLGEEVSF
jgi:predicted metal-dependent RNase